LETSRAARITIRVLGILRKILLSSLALLVAGTLFVYLVQRKEAADYYSALESRWESSSVEKDAGQIPPGDIVGWINIPRIGLNSPVVEMANVDDRENLNKGPAHLAGTAYPGEEGNCVIAGHRTTYSRPFFKLDDLVEGDAIFLTNVKGSSFSYVVKWKKIVEPDEVWVMEKSSGKTLTLIACHPLFSAKKRLVVRAEFEEVH